MITIYWTNCPKIMIYWTNCPMITMYWTTFHMKTHQHINTHKNVHICRILLKLQHTRSIGQFWLGKPCSRTILFFWNPDCMLLFMRRPVVFYICGVAYWQWSWFFSSFLCCYSTSWGLSGKTSNQKTKLAALDWTALSFGSNHRFG